MVVILVLLTLAVSIAIEVIRTRGAAAREPAERLPSATPVLERWFHPGHAWALIGGNADFVEIGADDFAQRFVGEVDRIDLPDRGSRIGQGERIATVHRGKRELELVSPITGVLVEVNGRLKSRPALLNQSPYERGWIAKVAPLRLHTELRSLFRGAAADRWREEVRSRLAGWFSPRLGFVMQDGGQWIDDVGAALSDSEWEEAAARLFPKPTAKNQTQPTRE